MRRAVVAVVVMTLGSCQCGPSDQECSDIASSAPLKTLAKAQQRAKGCNRDADCTLAPLEISCFKGCPAAVLASQASALQTDLAGVDDMLCNGTQCNITVGCTPTFAACTSGTCTAQPGDAGVPDAGSPDGG